MNPVAVYILHSHLQCVCIHYNFFNRFSHHVLCIYAPLSETQQLIFFFFFLMLLNWYHKGSGMYYSVYGMVYINDPLLLIGKRSPFSSSSRFSLNGPLPYVQCHITVNKMC